METAALRPFRKSPDALSVEMLQQRVGELASRRQELRAGGAGRAELEENRRLLAETQWELSHALIARYLPGLALNAA